jgi:xanthine dehydrogenase small subunit
MRNIIELFVNGERHTVQGAEAFMTLSDYLRYQRGLTGTKVVCAEGDCGACTVMVSRLQGAEFSHYQSINSCIAFMWQLDRSHVITVEGLKGHPVQESMVKEHGAQCGYCTPGFICAMAGMTDEAKREGFTLTEKKVKNYLTGNLCRCTGYDSIITAGTQVDASKAQALAEFYHDEKIAQEFSAPDLIQLAHEGVDLVLPTTVAEARKHAAGRKLVAGATDLGVLFNKGKWKPQKLLSLMHIPELYETRVEGEELIVGARVSLAELETKTEQLFPEFSRLLHIFASPQIKNTGTLVGNMLNASPIADTIPFLKVAQAKVVIQTLTGERVLDVNDFYKPGYKQLDLIPGEFVSHVRLPISSHRYRLFKVSKRKDLDISAVTMAIRYELQGETFKSFSLAVGGVGPTVLRMPQVESVATGKRIEGALMKSLAQALDAAITPLSDVRGSDKYRRGLCKNLLLKFGDELTREFNRAEVSV